MRRFNFPLVTLALGAVLVVFSYHRAPVTPTTTNTAGTPAVNAVLPNANASVAENPIQASANPAVPFTSQAPFGVWELAHDEGCEEASSLMVARFWLKQPITGPSDADREILAIEQWETAHLGYWQDTSAADTVKFIQGYWPGLTAEVRPLNSTDDLKPLLAAGFPVIVPTNGRLLSNPHYQDPGPRYHMLVVKGYDAKGFITNDSGTRFGADYHYSAATLFTAAHDWQGHEVADGAKVMIIIRPK